MSTMRFFIIFCLISTIVRAEEKSATKITVVVSQSDPLLQIEKMSQSGIGLEIIKTFAKSINHIVEYIVINKTLHTVFETEKSFEHFTHSYSISSKS